MASELPIVWGIPLYGIVYCGFAYALIVVLERLRRLINKKVDFMTKNEPNVEFNIGFRIFRIAAWITATTGCLALMAWFVAFAWAEIRSLI